jgi:hypothetical protein
MTETEERWAERVAGWRSSGQTSTEYCEGRGFTASGLRHWAYRLGKASGTKAGALARRPPVRVVRMERIADRVSPAAPSGVGLTIEIGAVRVVVPAGFDMEMVKNVLEAVGTMAGGRR